MAFSQKGMQHGKNTEERLKKKKKKRGMKT